MRRIHVRRFWLQPRRWGTRRTFCQKVFVRSGRFWSAYFFDPNGIRLEFATDRSGESRSVIESVMQTEAEARANTRTIPGAPGKLHTPAATHPAKVASPAPAKK